MRHWLVCLGLVLHCLPGPVWAEPAVINMGFYLPGIRDANLTDVRASLQLWAEEVGAGYDFKAHASMYNDMTELRRDALQGRVDLVIAPAMEMAETFALDELPIGFTGLRHDTDEGLVLIASRESGASQLAELRGKRMLRLANDRLSEVYLEVLCERQLGAACADIFLMGEEKRDLQSIHKVFFGHADAALVRASALRAASELNPQINARVSRVLDWKIIAISFGMLTARSSPAYRDRVLRAAMNSTKTVRGKQILELFKTDYMVQVDQSGLQPFWRLHREYRELKRAKSARKK